MSTSLPVLVHVPGQSPRRERARAATAEQAIASVLGGVSAERREAYGLGQAHWLVTVDDAPISYTATPAGRAAVAS